MSMTMQELHDAPIPDDVVNYIVVWRAGFEGERDLESFGNYWSALDWIAENYSGYEVEENNIAICTLFTSGDRTYES